MKPIWEFTQALLALLFSSDVRQSKPQIILNKFVCCWPVKSWHLWRSQKLNEKKLVLFIILYKFIILRSFCVQLYYFSVSVFSALILLTKLRFTAGISIAWVLKLTYVDILHILIYSFVVQAQEQTDVLQRKNKEEEEAYKVKKRTADLLPDASNNIVKLEVRVVLMFATSKHSQ